MCRNPTVNYSQWELFICFSAWKVSCPSLFKARLLFESKTKQWLIQLFMVDFKNLLQTTHLWKPIINLTDFLIRKNINLIEPFILVKCVFIPSWNCQLNVHINADTIIFKMYSSQVNIIILNWNIVKQKDM